MKEEIKAGIIIVTSLIILSGFIILIGGSQVFEKFDKYYIKVMNAAGLEVGSQVKLGGVRVGRVLSIKAPNGPGEPVTVEIGIRKGAALYKGTKASITQIGFVGDIYLLLSVDKTTTERIKVGDIIPSQEQVQFDVLMSKVDGLSQTVDGLIKDIDKLFSEKNIKGIETLIGNTNEAIVSGSSNLDKVASSLKGTTNKLELVLNEIEELVRDNKGEVSQMIKKAREDLEKAGEMIKSIEATAKSVEKTSKSADRVIELQSQNLEILLNTMNKTTEDLQDLFQEIKNKPWSIIYKERKGK
ncbi:MAG: MlaD family protein [Nitrospirota bacterium]|nr:MlaD family protein [Nitrospirota bacterium]